MEINIDNFLIIVLSTGEIQIQQRYAGRIEYIRILPTQLDRFWEKFSHAVDFAKTR